MIPSKIYQELKIPTEQKFLEKNILPKDGNLSL